MRGRHHRHPRRGAHRAAGFTLLETLVALAIFALAALALVRLQGFSLQSADQLARSNAAYIVAENAINVALSDPVRTIGTRTTQVTNMGRIWQVEENITAIAGANALRIDVTVRDDAGVRARLEALTGP